MTAFENHYVTLQVDPAAEPEVIESAYRRLARKYHPDVEGSNESIDRMRSINKAYAVLSDTGRRVLYDIELRREPHSESLGTRPLSSVELDPRVYHSSLEPLEAMASSAFEAWAADWNQGLATVVDGDARGYRQIVAAGEKCLGRLTECLAGWELLVAPPSASRLSELGAACLKLQLALVRGTLSFAIGGDFSMLGPLAGLAMRIGELARTIEAESSILTRSLVAHSEPRP